MQIAARICEIVSGKPWETLFQERIAISLEMSGATYYSPRGCSNPMVGGGARSGLHDYANFLRMIIDRGWFNGARILSVKTASHHGRIRIAT
jgi:CubicO group peptidase (beta-lactamase class C family)